MIRLFLKFDYKNRFARDKGGNNALMLAAKRNNFKVVEILLSSDDAMDLLDVRNSQEHNAYLVACQCGNFEAAEILFEYGILIFKQKDLESLLQVLSYTRRLAMIDTKMKTRFTEQFCFFISRINYCDLKNFNFQFQPYFSHILEINLTPNGIFDLEGNICS